MASAWAGGEDEVPAAWRVSSVRERWVREPSLRGAVVRGSCPPRGRGGGSEKWRPVRGGWVASRLSGGAHLPRTNVLLRCLPVKPFCERIFCFCGWPSRGPQAARSHSLSVIAYTVPTDAAFSAIALETREALRREIVYLCVRTRWRFGLFLVPDRHERGAEAVHSLVEPLPVTRCCARLPGSTPGRHAYFDFNGEPAWLAHVLDGFWDVVVSVSVISQLEEAS